MAEILLITGVPGHGKSLLAITKGLEFLKQGRPVYAAGFKELDYEATGFLPLPEPFESFERGEKDDLGFQLVAWQKLPDGAVIIYDECYAVIPQRAAGKPVPPHIDALARHRHYNIDVILVTQKHGQIDSFVQGLINTHIHVKRTWNLDRATLRTWDGFQANVRSTPIAAPIWAYPKKNYALYKSATSHSIKRKIPWFVYALPVLLGVVISLGMYVKRSMHASATGTAGASATDATGAMHAGTVGSGKAADDSLRATDYAKWLKPRVAGQPWTAPAWDQLQPQGVPDLFCIAVDDGRCSCQTEQGTKYEIAPAICRSIARDGIYNPFRKPLDGGRGGDRRGESREDRARPSMPVSEAPAPDVAAAGLQRGPSIPQTYLPPEYHVSQAED